MHRCLQILEVLSSIIGFAAYKEAAEDDWIDEPCLPYDSPTLLALALTCRMFSEPELEALWETQLTLLPLLRCFPSDIYEDVRDEFDVPIILFLRPPKSIDWVRIQFYSHRIKRLGIYDSKSTACGLTSENFAFLALHRPVLSILPRLEQLGCRDYEMLTHIRILLCPALTRLVVEWSGAMGDMDELAYMLEALRDLSPDLYSFRLLYRDLDSPLEEVIRHSFALPRLRILHCDPIYLSEDSIGELSSLLLENLKIAIDFDPTVALPNPEQAYSSLLGLHITSKYIEHCSSFLRLVTSPRLRFLHLRLEQSPGAASLCRFFENIAQHPSKKHVSDVRMKSIPDSLTSPSTSDFAITSFSLQPLLALPNIVVLRISLDCHFDLDDNILRGMASAWPQLQFLELRSLKARTRLPTATLRCLVPFAMNCPRLRTFIVALDARDVSQLDLTPRDNKLRYIHFMRSPIYDPASVAAFLSGVFPLISEIGAEGRVFHVWKQAEKLMKVFGAVRDQERQSAVGAIRKSNAEFVHWVHNQAGAASIRETLSLNLSTDVAF